MILHRTQARNLTFGIFFLSLLLSPISPCMAKVQFRPAQSMIENAESTDNAGHGAIIPFKSIFGDLFESKESDDDKKEEKKIIRARKLKDNGEEVGEEEKAKKPKPYKVYTSPMMEDKASARTAQPSYNEPTTQKTSQKIIKRKLITAPAIRSIPKQYFPILSLGQGPNKQAQLLPIASNHNLGGDHSQISRAIIAIHDISRNASGALATLATLTGANSAETLIMAPQFSLAVDISRFAKYLPDTGRHVARWNLDSIGWQFGGYSKVSRKGQGVSSYTAIDILMMYLSDRNMFPALEKIVIVGHGMGADFVQRYAATGTAPTLFTGGDVSLQFIAGNPSSYLYPTSLRPVKDSFRFDQADKKACADVNSYPYGVDNLPAYPRRKGASSIRLDYVDLPMTYLVGNSFVVDHYLDQNCAAEAQGKDRVQRGKNFSRYLGRSFGQKAYLNQTFKIIPNAGYDPITILGSECSMKILFGNGGCW